MGKPVVVFGAQPDSLQQGLDTFLYFLSRAPLMDFQRFRYNPADMLAGIERTEGVLKHHHHLAPQRPHLSPAVVADVGALE